MSAGTLIESLLSLGMTVKDAFVSANKSEPVDWNTFLGTKQFRDIQDEVQKLLQKIGKNEVQAALAAVQEKKKALLGGKPISALSPEKLLQFFDLLTVEGVLVRKELESASESAAFFDWLVEEALPKLVAVARVVVPLLL